MVEEITKAQLLAWRLGKLKEAGKVRPQQVSLAKRNNVRMARDIARDARDLLGANGITDEYQAGRHMCNLESVFTYEGTDHIHTLDRRRGHHRPRRVRVGDVALLRGINVGGKNKLPMATLSAMFADEGASAVTHVHPERQRRVRGAGEAGGRRSARASSGSIEKKLRAARRRSSCARPPSWPKRVARNPYVEGAASTPMRCTVMFLADSRPPSWLARARSRSARRGDEFALVGRDLYLRLPNGVARTKLTNAYFDKALATVSTDAQLATRCSSCCELSGVMHVVTRSAAARRTRCRSRTR